MRSTLTIAFTTVLLAGLAIAQAPEKTPDSAAARVDEPLTTMSAEELAQRTALHTELQASYDLEQQAVAAIMEEVKRAVTFEERQELQARASTIKLDATLERMNIQLVHARRHGRTEQSRTLEAEIDRFVERLESTRLPQNTSTERTVQRTGGEVR